MLVHDLYFHLEKHIYVYISVCAEGESQRKRGRRGQWGWGKCKYGQSIWYMCVEM